MHRVECYIMAWWRDESAYEAIDVRSQCVRFRRLSLVTVATSLALGTLTFLGRPRAMVLTEEGGGAFAPPAVIHIYYQRDEGGEARSADVLRNLIADYLPSGVTFSPVVYGDLAELVRAAPWSAGDVVLWSIRGNIATRAVPDSGDLVDGNCAYSVSAGDALFDGSTARS